MQEPIQPLPNSWNDIEAEVVYKTSQDRFVAFSKSQIQLGIKHDPNNKHIKAIEKGEVSPRGNMGLVASQEEGYYLKSKILGKGGNYRFHAKYIAQSFKNNNNDEQLYMILYFPGLMTQH